MRSSSILGPLGPAVARALWILLAAIMLTACATQTAKQQAFSVVSGLETRLARGESTKADVLELLGEPSGAGEFGGFHAVRGPEHAKKGPADIWYYEDSRAAMGVGGRMSERIQVLLVFFQGDVYDGFLWLTAAAQG